ncbi:exopolyphosphatase [Kaistia dalseonensis]|uniref:exopolyphosphatase n=1 Tax=Kaistia dalseonensis TaxID=410840 RepID=A0ABU0H0H6_9HYPH|nr:exopolyphosphatase [Kaistia dalseonensis]MCX5493261.1 exopolyphosphatase [Kaistia dalseonensis]MDQ0435818.1 exopolyphosphatase/guanosine-5'-triphosphate,3'-diphosphate pyrophosphatase [Kaistia dalseonensis]
MTEGEEHAPGRLNGSGPVAIIDIGSNSVRLVVYERMSRSPMPLFNEKELAGLGRGVATTGRLNEDAVQAALAAIRRFVGLCGQMRVKTIHVLATAAAREATNGPSFLDEVETITGAPVSLLSGREEARLSAMGVLSGIHKPNGIAGDLGGGSLEVVDIVGQEVGIGETFPLGGLRLEEASEKTLKKAAAIAAEALTRSTVLPKGQGRPFYAIGGTWRSLARLHMRQKGYPLHIMHEYAIPADEALDFCRMVARRDAESLDSIEAVSKSRRNLLPYGAIVLEQVIRAMKPSEIILSALGVREGLLYDLLDAETRAIDPLIAASEELAILRSRSPVHARELGPWTAQAMSAMGYEESDDEARLRIAACLLADIGWRGHPDYRGEQSLNLISHGAFVGIDHPGRAYLALATYYRHEGLADEHISSRIRELASTRLMERARALGAAFRVAFLVSGAMGGIIPQTRIEARGDQLTLVLPEDRAILAGTRLGRRVAQLAKLAGMKPAIVLE